MGCSGSRNEHSRSESSFSAYHHETVVDVYWSEEADIQGVSARRAPPTVLLLELSGVQDAGKFHIDISGRARLLGSTMVPNAIC